MFHAKRDSETRVKYAQELASTFFHKCYICECGGENDRIEPEIDHRIPKHLPGKGRSLLDGWNLFYACVRCNGQGIKGEGFYEESDICECGNGYLGIIDCTKCDPNEYIVLKIDYEGNVIVETKKAAPCAALTEELLKKVYGSDVKIRDDKLCTLINKIIEEDSRLQMMIRKLNNNVKCNYREDLIEDNVVSIIALIQPNKPFFAFKLSCLQKAFEDASNIKLKSILSKILNDQSLHPSTPINCNITKV